MDRDCEKHFLTRESADWFRGLAVIMVVLSHYAEWWGWLDPLKGAEESVQAALMKLGVYGVDIFFVLSGYAMVRSMDQERMYFGYVRKRIRRIYIPYLLVMGMIELLSGGFDSLRDFGRFVSGYDHWYMFVFFLLQLGFIAVYTIFGSSGSRLAAFAGFTAFISFLLYRRGMQDFWYVSNPAFVIGVAAGEYETLLGRIVDRAGRPLAMLLAVALLPAVWAGLTEWADMVGLPPEERLWLQIGAGMIWTLLILVLASGCRTKRSFVCFLGKRSYYIYLTHTYIFMRCVNALDISLPLRFVVSAVVTVAVSCLLGRMTAGGRRPSPNMPVPPDGVSP